MPGDRLLTEWRTISISRPGGETLVDTHGNLQASRALTLTGDLQHAGFHFRAHDEVSSRTSETSFIESPAGFVAGNDLEWCQMTFGRGARRYAVALYNAPDNPVEELSQRTYGRFGYFFIQSIADGANLALNYRIRLAEADLPDGSSFEIYEAEDATLGGWATIASNSGGYTGSGYIDYQTPSGEFIEWTVPVESAGDYSASIRYALLSGDRPLELTVNGVVVDATFSFPATGGWTSWGTVPLTLSLNAGSNTVRVTAIGSSGANVDHLLIELLGNADPDGGAQASRATNDQAYLNYQQWLQMDLDSDLDGLPDTWEARFFGDLSRDGTDDEDGDGTSNLTDQVAATDPTNPSPAFESRLWKRMLKVVSSFVGTA